MIQFVDGAGKRRSFRLGKVNKRQAEHVRLRVEQRLGAKLTGTPIDADTAKWVSSISVPLQQKLGSVGLIQTIVPIGLSDFIEQYINGRSDTKPSTRVKYAVTHQRLLRSFKADQPIRSITPEHAANWRQRLLDDGLADNTVRRTVGVAKQFFTAAIKQGYLTDNPFGGLPCAVRPNKKRDYFVTREQAEAVLRACPDDEWRLLFTLCRFAGLRCPSEILRLRWADIDLEKGRFTVTSPKTEHHDGHGSRVVPLFPEVADALAPFRRRGPDPEAFVIRRYRHTNVNLRTLLYKIIRRAGYEPWPKLFQNLRASCETELAERFPLHVVTAWLGNSVAVAQKHYLQVTNEHMQTALMRGHINRPGHDA